MGCARDLWEHNLVCYLQVTRKQWMNPLRLSAVKFLTQQLKVNFYLFWKIRISKLSNLEDFTLSSYSLDIFNAAFFKLHYSIAPSLWPGNNRRDYANLLKYMLGTSHCKETREHNFVFREEESREIGVTRISDICERKFCFGKSNDFVSAHFLH